MCKYIYIYIYWYTAKWHFYLFDCYDGLLSARDPGPSGTTQWLSDSVAEHFGCGFPTWPRCFWGSWCKPFLWGELPWFQWAFLKSSEILMVREFSYLNDFKDERGWIHGEVSISEVMRDPKLFESIIQSSSFLVRLTPWWCRVHGPLEKAPGPTWSDN